MFVVNATKTENGGTRLTVVPHVCGICKKAFLQERTLLDHFQTHEENPSVSSVSTQNEPEVTKSFIKTPDEVKETVLLKQTTNINSNKKSHSCSICERSFSSKTYLYKHIKLHKGERSFQCDICNKSFVLKDNLMKHFSTHDPDKKRYFCLECGKGFTSRQYKEKHELIHLGEKPHVCGICSRAFTLKTNLNKHVLIHSEDRYKYLCDICGKGFSSKAYLDKHHLIHAGEKPHVCGICHRAFTLKTNLHKHYLTHTGYRRFGCEICFKRFKTKGSLEQHYVIHSGERPFACVKCDQCFKQKAHLDRHLQTHIDFANNDNCSSEILSINEDCVEVIIGEQDISEDYDNDFDDERGTFFDAGIVDSKNNRAYNVSTDICESDSAVRELFSIKHQPIVDFSDVKNEPSGSKDYT